MSVLCGQFMSTPVQRAAGRGSETAALRDRKETAGSLAPPAQAGLSVRAEYSVIATLRG
jgi:hypothetical protein